MDEGLNRLATAAREGTIPSGAIENGTLRLERLASNAPPEADALVLNLYACLPEVRITDILIEVAAATGFTDAFTHLRTGAPCGDRVGLLNVLLAEGLNLGLSKMAEASNTHDFFQLSRLSRWHIEGEAINRALAIVIEAQAQLPTARFWGLGLTASSDGQFFPAARQGKAMNLVNARYGNAPGLKAYTHLSDQFGPFATQTIPATVNEAPYILDGLLMNEAGRKIREQYADTGGFTDHVFAVTALLGYRFMPRIRDLPSKRLHVFEPKSVPGDLRGLIGGRIRQTTITGNWPDVLRSAATMAAGTIPPSQLLRKFAAYPQPARSCPGATRDRTDREDALHHRLAARRRIATPGPERAQQGRSAPRAQERLAHRPSGRNPRPHHRRPAFTHSRPEPPCRHHHLLEHASPRPCCRAAPERRTQRSLGAPGAHLAARMGAYPAHGRISMAGNGGGHALQCHLGVIRRFVRTITVRRRPHSARPSGVLALGASRHLVGRRRVRIS